MNPDYDDDVWREILEEKREYQENYFRSEEEGWFYSDDDEQ